jgi:hypothetical protein
MGAKTMPIPVCFMVMPFGKKLTNAETDKVPSQIDFDLLWDKVLRPMIQDDLKYMPIRADQDAGSLIIQAMIERLAISDLVIADLTIPNANVYYEVGVRHAAQRQGCVLIAADWSKPLFDVSQMRRVKYPLSDGAISDEAAAAIKKALEMGIKQSVSNTSPVFQAIPGFPDHVEPSQLQSFRDVACRLAAFQSEVSVARGLPPTAAANRVKELIRLYAEDAFTVPSIALDLTHLLRDTRQWDIALKFIADLPRPVSELPEIREQRALMLGKLGQQVQAISELETLIRTDGDTSERSGLIGGQYKTLYDSAPDAESKSVYLNKTVISYERAMMLDLNDYYPSSNLPRLYRDRRLDEDEKKAVTAANLAMLACERSRKRRPDDPWAALTMLGAAFDAGDISSANSLLGEITKVVTAPFYIQSTIPDLRRSLSLLTDVEMSSALASILAGLQRLLDPKGTVIALAGRRVDPDSATEPRFPPENEALVGARIRNTLVSAASQGVVCSVACGADILTLESATQLGLSRRVVLPFQRDRFRLTSVADCGEAWGRRFDAILEHLQSKDIVELNLQTSGDEAYATVNAKILDEASRWASGTGRRALAAVVWNGFTRGATDLTDAFRQLAVERKLETITISTL